jgi:GTP-binding protein YchF
MRVGIVGLPNVGKSTLFNALTQASVAAENYPFCTIEPNIGRAVVPDPRLDELARIIQPEKAIPSTMDFVDIAGLVKGASQGEGLGNQFLGQIRDVDAIVEVVRCFKAPDVVHVGDGLDPRADIETIELELVLADLELINRRRAKLERQLKSGEPWVVKAYDYLNGLYQQLETGRICSQSLPILPPGLESSFGDLNLLTVKPLLLVANVDDEGIAGSGAHCWKAVVEAAKEREAGALWLAARLEEELWELEPNERADFLAELDLSEPGLNRLIAESYKLLGLITFFTVTGGHEVRAWPLKRGTTAVKAAGKIHSDMERGFIRAEVVAHSDLIRVGSPAAAQKEGLMRLEGRDYIVRDGDVIHYRFSV